MYFVTVHSNAFTKNCALYRYRHFVEQNTPKTKTIFSTKNQMKLPKI